MYEWVHGCVCVYEFPHRFRCVELNYPAPIAGCALFDWHNMTDRLSLHEMPFELRWAIDRVWANVRWVIR